MITVRQSVESQADQIERRNIYRKIQECTPEIKAMRECTGYLHRQKCYIAGRLLLHEIFQSQKSESASRCPIGVYILHVTALCGTTGAVSFFFFFSVFGKLSWEQLGIHLNT
jgi:hypothetical protein